MPRNQRTRHKLGRKQLAEWRRTFALSRYQEMRSRQFGSGLDLLCALIPKVDDNRGVHRLRNAVRKLKAEGKSLPEQELAA